MSSESKEPKFVKVPASIARHPDLSPIDKLVYWEIKSWCGPAFKGKFFESTRTIASVLSVSRASVIRSLDKLVSMGLIQRIGSNTRSTSYMMHDPSAVLRDDYIRAVSKAGYDPKKWVHNTLSGKSIAKSDWSTQQSNKMEPSAAADTDPEDVNVF